MSANYARSAGNLAVAQEHIRRALALRDDVADYWRLWGRIAMDEGKLPDAYLAFRSALALDPHDYETMRYICTLGAELADPGVERYSEELLKAFPNDPQGLIAKGRLALERREGDEALKDAQIILSAQPEDAAAQMLMARAYSMQHKYNEATSIIEKLLKTHSTEPILLEDMKLIYSERGDQLNYEHMFELLTIAQPSNWHYQINLAEVLYARGDLASAYAVVKSMMKAHPRDLVLASELLKLLQRQGASAIPLYGIESDAADVSLPMRVVYAAYANGQRRPDIALSLINPNAPDVKSSISAIAAYAEALMVSGRNAEALKAVEAALKVDPAPTRAMLIKARVLYAQKNTEGALANARILVASDPGNIEAQLLLAELLFSRAETTLAFSALRDGLAATKGDVMIAASLMQHLDATGQAKAAQDVIDELAQAQPMNRRVIALRNARCSRPGVAKCRELKPNADDIDHPAV